LQSIGIVKPKVVPCFGKEDHHVCERTARAFFIAGTLGVAMAPVFGQGLATGGIRGRVIDPSGAALAGVTVSATSPSLLVERVTTEADSSGDYKLTELPIGTYKVVFEAKGFQQFIRDNVVLTAGFTATIDVSLRVGDVNESVTVSAEAPVVDTEHNVTSTNLNAQTLTEVIPTTRNAVEFLSTTPGVVRANRPDFGGGTSGGGQYAAYGIQGQMTMLMDGVNTTQSVINQGTGNGPDLASLEEMQVVSVSGTAETANPGILLNLIVKSGGNQFHGRYEGTGETDAVQADNITPALRALPNFTVGQGIISYETFNGDLGGPLKKDKLWFYGAYAFQHAERTALNFVAYPQGTNIYNVSSTKGTPADLSARLQNMTGKGTYQLTPKYKLVGFYAMHTELFYPYPTGPSALSPWENNPQFHWNPHQMKAEIQGTPTPRLVFSASVGRQAYDAYYSPEPDVPPGPAVLNVTTGLNLGPSLTHTIRPRTSIGPTVTVSYFPGWSRFGTHEIKAGFSYLWQNTSTKQADISPYSYQLQYINVNNVPTPYQVVTYNYPTNAPTYQNQGGWFVQDAWHPVKRVVINAGFRIDHYATGLPAVTREASQFAQAASYPGLNTGSWTAVAPRIGVSWNVFGDNKTVIRGSYGWFNHAFGDDYAGTYSQSGVATVTYQWNAPVGTTVLGPGQIGNSISQTGGSTQLLNPNLKDPHTTEFVAGVEREIIPGISLKLNYTWIKQINLFGNYNILRPYSAWSIPYTTYTTGKPIVDPGPDGITGTADDGGPIIIWGYPQQYAGAAFVQNQTVAYPNSSAPIFKVLDLIVAKRFAGKWGFNASMTAIRNHTSAPSGTLAGFGTYIAPIPASPNSDYFNYDRTWNWQAKSTIYYNLPWRFVTSSTFEAYNGLHGQRLVNFTGIGTPNIGTITIPLEPFGASTGPTRILWNMKVSREFRFKERFRLVPSVDLLNLLNRADQWAITFTSGPNFLVPTTINTPRIAKFGLVFSF
jgi:hypothetical protein